MKIHVDDKVLAIYTEDKYEEIFIKSFFTYPDMSKAFAGGSYNEMNVKKVLLCKKVKDWFFTKPGLS